VSNVRFVTEIIFDILNIELLGHFF